MRHSILGGCLGLISMSCIMSIFQQTNEEQRGPQRASEPASPTSDGDFGKGRPAADVKSGEEASKPGVQKPSDYRPPTRRYAPGLPTRHQLPPRQRGSTRHRPGPGGPRAAASKRATAGVGGRASRRARRATATSARGGRRRTSSPARRPASRGVQKPSDYRPPTQAERARAPDETSTSAPSRRIQNRGSRERCTSPMAPMEKGPHHAQESHPVSVAAVLLTLCGASDAHAWFRFTNKTSETVQVVFQWRSPNCPDGGGGRRGVGGSCAGATKTVFGSDLQSVCRITITMPRPSRGRLGPARSRHAPRGRHSTGVSTPVTMHRGLGPSAIARRTSGAIIITP